jgi:hypothetical protein
MAFNLGDISPLAGIATGKGMIGKLAGKGGLGLIPKMIANDAQEQRAAEAEAERVAGEEKKQAALLARESTPTAQMKNGGVTSSASKRGDGIAQRGKTRGKMY